MSEERWEKVKDDNGEVYWWNTKTNESSWTEPPGMAAQESREISKSPVLPPPPPKRGAGPMSPNASTGKIGNLVSAGSSMVKSNSVRLRNIIKKDEPKKDPPPAPLSTAPHPHETPPSGGWEARRKKSFQAAYQAVQAVKTNLAGNNLDPSTIDGHIQIQAKETNRNVNEVIREAKISNPFDVQKKMEVSFDADKIQFKGLPEGWAEEAHKQFGVPLPTCPRMEVEGYTDRIPIVLVKLKVRFLELGGAEADGIFRLAPDGQDVADAKMSINAGQALKSLERTKDPHVVANLIKQFFRELKPKVLNVLTKDDITTLSNITDLDELGRRIERLPDPQRSTFFWLLDLLSEVASKQEVNRMTPTNLAIVLSPNLFDAGRDMDPYQELLLSQRVAAFASGALKWRIEYRKANGLA